MAADGVHSLLFLTSQILKRHSIQDLLNFLIVFLISLLFKPSFLKEHKKDLERYPPAPTSTAKRSTHQPLDCMIVFKAKYFLILVLFQDSIFSSQGHVSSMTITFLKLFEKIVISGLSWVKAMWTWNQYLLKKSTKRTQSDAWCKIPTGGVLLGGTFTHFFSHTIDYLAEIDTVSFIVKILIFHLGKKSNKQKNPQQWQQQHKFERTHQQMDQQ